MLKWLLQRGLKLLLLKREKQIHTRVPREALESPLSKQTNKKSHNDLELPRTKSTQQETLCFCESGIFKFLYRLTDFILLIDCIFRINVLLKFFVRSTLLALCEPQNISNYPLDFDQKRGGLDNYRIYRCGL